MCICWRTWALPVARSLLVGGIARDRRARGRPWWPWAVPTLAAGYLAPLACLLWKQPR